MATAGNGVQELKGSWDYVWVEILG